MKRIRLVLIITFCLLLMNVNVYAASASLATSSSSVYVGDSFTVSVNMNMAAAWNIHVNSSGPVSDCIINQADATEDAQDINKTFSVTCKATNTGTITITLSGDVTSVSDMKAVKLSGSKTVTVTQRPVDNRSKNNKVKSISIEGYDLVKVSDNKYTLTVGNNVNEVNVKVTAEDSKATISGAGKHMLINGDNTFEVTITAENGAKNKITIIVTKKDSYTLSELDMALNEKNDKIDISLDSNDKVTIKNLNTIKEKKKTVNLNYYDSEKKLLYSWIIDGKNVNEAKEFNPDISSDSNNKQDLEKASNYAEGLVFDFKHSGSLPEGIKVKLYVGDKYSNNDSVNVYHYLNDKKELELLKDSITVKDGYIDFDIKECSKYFVTKANITNTSDDEQAPVVTECNNTPVAKDNSSLYKIIIGVLLLVIAGLIAGIVIILKKKKNHSVTPDVNEETISMPIPADSPNSGVPSQVTDSVPQTNNVKPNNK